MTLDFNNRPTRRSGYNQFVSVIIPLWNEAKWVSKLHQSLIQNGYPPERFELLYIDGDSDDGTVAIIQSLIASQSRPTIRLLKNPDRTTARALNIGISAAHGEIILRADAHAWYEPGYIETSVRLLSTRPDLGGVGGQVRVMGSGSYWSDCIAMAMNSVIGNGGVTYRIGEKARYTDTLWCGCWRRETLKQLGGFNEAFITNQDYELNFRLREAGKPLLFEPTIRANYFCRQSLLALAKQYFRYGLGRARTVALHPHSLQLRQLLALTPLATVLLALLIVAWRPELSALIVGTYLLSLLLVSLRSAIKQQRLLHCPGMVSALLVMHLCWGVGLVRGGVRYLFDAVSRRLTPEQY